MDYDMKDSGARQEFSTGARRDSQEGKGRYDLISTVFLKRLAVVMEKGASKYGDRNWEKGMPLSRYFNSAVRHLTQAFEGQVDEDHVGQAAFNVMAFMHTLYMIDCGLLPRDLDDRQLSPIDREFPPHETAPVEMDENGNAICECRECVTDEGLPVHDVNEPGPTRTSVGDDEPLSGIVIDLTEEAQPDREWILRGEGLDKRIEQGTPDEGMVQGLDGVWRGKSTVDASVAPGTPPQEPICGPPVAVSRTMDAIRYGETGEL